MRCKICKEIATRSSKYGVFCEKHYWSDGKDGSSVSEQVAKQNYEVKGNYD